MYAPGVGESRYRTVVLRAWTKDGLALLLRRELEGCPRESVVSVESGVDFQFFWPWRRNWAMLVVERTDG